jgi:hypothetical protein
MAHPIAMAEDTEPETSAWHRDRIFSDYFSRNELRGRMAAEGSFKPGEFLEVCP